MAVKNTSRNGWNTKVFAFAFYIPSMDHVVWLDRESCPSKYDIMISIVRSNGAEVRVKDTVRAMRDMLPNDAQFIGSDFVEMANLFPVENLPSWNAPNLN